MRMFVLAALALGFANPAHAARVKITGATASSVYTDGDTSYDAAKVHDGKQSTSWVEGDSGSGLGAWVELDFGSAKNITKVMVWGGDWYDHGNWSQANRPQQLELKTADGQTFMMDLADEMKIAEFTFPKPVSTDKLRVRIKKAYAGSAWLDTVISEIQVYSDDPGEHVPVASASASSTAPADGDGNYEAARAVDGIYDAMWCEGNKDSDGTGETLTLNLGGSHSVNSMTIINGMASSLGLWMKGNRATELELTFSDGAKETVAVKPSIRPVTVSFPEHTTSSIQVKFTKIMKGREYNDACISEIWFDG